MEVRIKEGNGYVDAEWTIEDGVMVVSPKEVKFEPKDGDVVYVKASYDNIIIYKESDYGIGRYVNFSDNQYLHTDDVPLCDKDVVKEIRPATEEEKQKLFDKLAEEGYEFDFDKKELVKLKWKPKEGKQFWYPFMCIRTEYSPMSSYFNKGRDKDLMDKDWCFKTLNECQEFCNRLNEAINSVKP